MKKLIMLWLFAIISIISFAQNTTEHLSYMGIPITGRADASKCVRLQKF